MQKLGLVGLLVLAAVFENKTTTLTPKETKVEQPIEQPTQNQVEEPKEALDLSAIKQPYLDEIENLKAQLVTLQELNRELSKEIELNRLNVAKVNGPKEDTREQSATETAKSIQASVQQYYYPVNYSNSACSSGSCSTGRRGLFGGFFRGR